MMTFTYLTAVQAAIRAGAIVRTRTDRGRIDWYAPRPPDVAELLPIDPMPRSVRGPFCLTTHPVRSAGICSRLRDHGRRHAAASLIGDTLRITAVWGDGR